MSDEMPTVADAEAAYERARAAGDPTAEWQAMAALSRAYVREDRLEDALALAQRALEFATNAGDKPLIATVHETIGACFLTLGNSYRAAPAFERAAKIRAALGDDAAYAAALVQAIAIRTERAEWYRAEPLIEKALNAARAANRLDLECACLGQRGDIAAQHGRWTAAEEDYRAAVSTARRADDPLVLALILDNYATALLDRPQRGADALAALTEAESLARAAGNQDMLADILNSLALAASVTGDRSRALAALEEAIALARALGDEELVHVLETNRSLLEQDQAAPPPEGAPAGDMDFLAALSAIMSGEAESGSFTVPPNILSGLLGGLSPAEAGRVEPLRRLPRKTTPKIKDSPIYQLKATLRNVKPPIWRRILVRSGITLRVLHDTLQVIMGWYDGHLHEFEAAGMTFSMPDVDWDVYGQVAYDEKKARLDQVVSAEGEKIRYLYDFGDSWEVDLVLEKILPPDPKGVYPVCVKGKRHGPPDDSGGPWGYTELLEVVKNPAHPDHEEYSGWLPEDFDPEEFDLAGINSQLTRLQK